MDKAVGFQLLHERGDCAVRDHQKFGNFGHGRAGRLARELCQQVEAGQRGVELLAQPGVQRLLDPGGAGEQPQPDAQFQMRAVGFVRRLDRPQRLPARALRGSDLSFDCGVHGCDLTGLNGN